MAKLAVLAVLASLLAAVSCQSSLSKWSIYIGYGYPSWGPWGPPQGQGYAPRTTASTQPPPRNDLKVGYYAGKNCSNAEEIVRKAVVNATAGVQAGLIRLFFHDCFVRGCDASVLLEQTADGPRTERQGFPNQSLRGFDVIEAAKDALEKECPGVVSCADILAFAARDASSILSHGKIEYYPVPAGRYDGNVSLESDVLGKNLPPPFADLATLTQMFADKGLNQTDMVVLSGGHSIGRSHCPSIDRVQPPNSPSPSMDPALAAKLNQTCDTPDNATTTVPQDDVTENDLDIQYYKNVLSGRVLFTSDAALNSTDTRELVKRYAGDISGALEWYLYFAEAMVKMGNIGVKTGPPRGEGEIRNKCGFVNPPKAN